MEILCIKISFQKFLEEFKSPHYLSQLSDSDFVEVVPRLDSHLCVGSPEAKTGSFAQIFPNSPKSFQICSRLSETLFDTYYLSDNTFETCTNPWLNGCESSS